MKSSRIVKPKEELQLQELKTPVTKFSGSN
jgi:hypothetical protein